MSASVAAEPATFAHLLVDTAPSGVRTITLNRPDRLNAVNPALARELPEAVAAAGREDAVRVVVITGAGRGFCAGLDLADPTPIGQGTRAERTDPYEWVGRWVLALAECEKPVIAAVNGAAAGAGLGLALAADVRLVSDAARLTAGYARIGLSPDAGVSWWLPRLVGASRAADLILTARDVDAAEAERIGLASRVLPAASFAEGVREYAERLAAGPPVALALTKRLLVASPDNELRAHLREELANIRTCLATRDVREAMTAFREKRRAEFRGE